MLGLVTMMRHSTADTKPRANRLWAWMALIAFGAAMAAWLPHRLPRPPRKPSFPRRKGGDPEDHHLFQQLHLPERRVRSTRTKRHISQGVFYMSQTGSSAVRILTAQPFLVVADGTYVIIKDKRMKRADHYPLSVTPLRLVLSENIDLLGRSQDHPLLPGPLRHLPDA